jgi:CRISPR-associated protein Csb2
MFALEVEFLTGRFVATSHDDRDRPEWPPHPARLVFALIAAAGPERTPHERVALEWLCNQTPPAIAFTDAWPRSTVTAFVPVNDRALPDTSQAAAGTLPRGRQPRTFPCVIPDEPAVTYIWPDADPDERTRALLSSLGQRLVYLGHSSSLVRACVVDEAPPATLVPGRGGRLLRVPSAGLVEALDSALARYEATGVRGPLPTDYAAYGVALLQERDEVPGSVFDEVIVLRRVDGPRIPLAAAEQVALSLRAAVMSAVPDPVPDIISGHGPDGSPLQQPHVAFLAIPDTGHHHARGSLLGIAAALPRYIGDPARNVLVTALTSISELRISPTLRWSVEPLRIGSGRPASLGLAPATWTRPARRYATATPVELDRYVDDRLGDEAEEIVAESAVRIGLPRPIRVRLSPVSALDGGGHVKDIRRAGDRPKRPLVHAILDFDESVRGPVLLGSGRYRGLGLCRPLERL